MSRSREALIGHWDRQAPRYDARTASMEHRVLEESRRWVCGRARGATLELAIGTGANLPHYPADVELTGIDWSEKMLAVAREQAARSRPDAVLQRADATALPFPDGSFDTVLSTFAMCCVPDERAVLAEALRVLRPDGHLLLADHVAASGRVLRGLQWVAELVTVPLHGEHFTRRPLVTLGTLDVTVVETERTTRGMIERLHARPGSAEASDG